MTLGAPRFASLAVAAVLLRRRGIHGASTAVERRATLPGDQLLASPTVSDTRAITIAAGVPEIWPWLVQLGQNRGGFYSYDRLENLVGADIHSADSVVPQWQQLAVGAAVTLAPGVPLTAAEVQPERWLVLRGAVPMGRFPVPYDFTWSFVLRAEGEHATRLLVRERYLYLRPWAGFVIRPVELISSVMTHGMLRGIRRRAERAVASPAIVDDTRAG